MRKKVFAKSHRVRQTPIVFLVVRFDTVGASRVRRFVEKLIGSPSVDLGCEWRGSYLTTP
jgi:hypothetical protein